MPLPPLERILLRALLEHLPDSIYFKDRQSRFIRVNAALSRWAGAAGAKELVGRSDFDLFTAEHAQPAFDAEQRIIATGEPLLACEEKETWPDGRTTWVSTTKLPLRDLDGTIIGTFGISHDITARKQNEERLRKLTRAVDQSPVAIVITDPAGRIEYVNPYFERVTGYTVAEALGQTPRMLKSGAHPREFYQSLWETIASGHDWTGELQNRRKDGNLFWERATISAVRDETGEITNYIAVKEDISEHRRAEAEKRALEAQLEFAHKLESVGRLSAGIAHEINTPGQFIADNLRFLSLSFQQLARYFAAVQDLRERAAALPQLQPELAALAEVDTEIELDFLRQEIPNCLTQSLDGTAHISRIIGALKDFAHPHAAGRSPADLAHLIETAAAVSRHEWKHVAEFTTEFDPQLPPVPVLVDEFNQAILNLIINAAHAIAAALKQRGGTKGRITARTRATPTLAIIEIEDTGTGIPEAARPHLFEPFFSTKGPGGGTGQGLHVVARVVHRHGGHIVFTTEVDRGTTFRLLLPLEALPSATPAPDSGARFSPAQPEPASTIPTSS
ncbi:MAG: PAS domain S-box protein [Opitutaceae bacterium]|nr:PAS domain S-box protein [Opitutaceae bacterium]